MRVLIAGCGYVGTALGLELALDGHEVFGLRRDPSGLPSQIEPVAANLLAGTDLREALPTGIEAVVITASADSRDPAAYRRAYVDAPANLLRLLEGRGDPVRRVLFTSSTAVYGQRDDEWVDEDSDTAPSSETGRILVEAEERFHDAPFTTVVTRLGGIYGPGRTRLLEQVRRGEATCPEETTYTNRIHREDCAGALAHLLTLNEPADVYCVVDRDPAERCVVLRWLAEQLGAPEPAVSPGTRRRGSKRVRSDRLISSGYALRFPSFREGYAPLTR
ncbi:MAG: SDR family oxidoreductase [Nitriliruptorales bacterium]|nr:SDR family oxidoreductase [Nitriliruptorales bacterium]